jgi:aryl-alcohol dehydrogenase-like predicted oxidoreductase
MSSLCQRIHSGCLQCIQLQGGVDTAGFYRRGTVQANELIRRALSPYRDDLVIATKVGPLPTPDGVPSGQATPDQLRGLVEADLTISVSVTRTSLTCAANDRLRNLQPNVGRR